jgi:hypothetical protein
MTMLLTERCADQIQLVLSCFDRVVLSGMLPEFGHAKVATHELFRRQIRIFDFPQFANGLREAIRAHAEGLAAREGVTIEFVRSLEVRKEAVVDQVLARRGRKPGLVHILSAMESCHSFKPWHDKQTGKTFLRPDTGKCLHYYFYFLDEELGLCYLRVPTWAPFRLQFYFNGHHWLAGQLTKRGIGFTQMDNAFLTIDDPKRAQKLVHSFSVKRLHRRLTAIVRTYCPAILDEFEAGYHWSIMQAELATDIAFRSPATLAPLYDQLVRTSIHAVKADQVATFLGRKLDPRYQGEVGNHFQTRIQGTRIKHHMGRVALKMYDKFGQVLRLETVANDVSFFKHHRRVEHRDGTWEMKLAPVRKTIYSLPALADLMGAANRRYLEFLSALDDVSPGAKQLDRVTHPVREGDRTFRGFNLLAAEDITLLRAITRGEFTISGFQNKDLRRHLADYDGRQISHVLKRLRTHGLIKKIGRTYKYYLTRLGRRVAATALKLREFVVIPTLAQPLPSI